MIGHETAILLSKGGEKVSIEIAPGRIAMQHDHRLPASFVHKVHRKTIHHVILGKKREGSFKSLIFQCQHRAAPFLLYLMRFCSPGQDWFASSSACRCYQSCGGVQLALSCAVS